LIHFFFIHCSASSAFITPKIDKLAVGFSTAEIRLWGIGETVLVKSKNKQARIPFACDAFPIHKDTEQENIV